MVKLITIKKDGKITLPMDVRKEIGLNGEDQYVMATANGEIIFKKVVKNDTQKRMLELLKRTRVAFKKAGITKKDVEEAIKAVRNKK